MERKSGVLMHISSLDSEYGIGTMGDSAKRFVDFLSAAHQTYWQVLPLNQTSFGDSPYQSFSSFAGNPYFIDLDYLKSDGLLNDDDYKHINWMSNIDSINYEVMYIERYKVLKIAVDNFFKLNKLDEYNAFIKDNEWVNSYSLFMAIKHSLNDVELSMWPIKYRLKDQKAISIFINNNVDLINFYKVIQFLFYKQWNDLKSYANSKGIYIIGDCPIYVSADSADVWDNPELFVLDENLVPLKVAGCPPDYFSKDGQLWGNPIYNWDNHQKDNYKWWINRVKHLTNIYDKLRIDHFRGFSAYYSIDNKTKDAKNGVWNKGPGKNLIDVFKNNVKDDCIIAEDLGTLDDDVRDLLKYSNYPGMRVLQFGFDLNNLVDNENMPFNIEKNKVVYIGTHDNDTVMGWLNSLDDKTREYVLAYVNNQNVSEFNWDMIRLLFSTSGNLAIVQAQDLLGLDSKSRINTPSTLGTNWLWRANKGVFDDKLCEKLRYLSHLYARA